MRITSSGTLGNTVQNQTESISTSAARLQDWQSAGHLIILHLKDYWGLGNVQMLAPRSMHHPNLTQNSFNDGTNVLPRGLPFAFLISKRKFERQRKVSCGNTLITLNARLPSRGYPTFTELVRFQSMVRTCCPLSKHATGGFSHIAFSVLLLHSSNRSDASYCIFQPEFLYGGGSRLQKYHIELTSL